MDRPAPTRSCPACGARVGARSRFCGGCGRDLSTRSVVELKSEGRRAALAAGTVFVGVLALLVLLGVAPPILTETELRGELTWSIGLVAIGVAAAAWLGAGALRTSLAGPASVRGIAVGAAVGVAVLAVTVTLLTGLAALSGEDPRPEWSVPEPLLWPLVSVAVLPAFLEEWLTRGVLWTAVRRLAEVRATIVLTAVLFALLHGLGQGRAWEFPTRFLAGLAFGWLRARSDSLGPGIAAHFVNNALAICVS